MIEAKTLSRAEWRVRKKEDDDDEGGDEEGVKCTTGIAKLELGIFTRLAGFDMFAAI
jgi:hypothetical protein